MDGAREIFENTAISFGEAKRNYRDLQKEQPLSKEASLAIVPLTGVGWGCMLPEYFLQLARHKEIRSSMGVYLYIVAAYNNRSTGGNNPVPVPLSFIAKELLITPQAARMLLERLINKGKIKRTKKAIGTLPSEYVPTQYTWDLE